MSQPKPVTAAEFEVGKDYIELTVDYKGGMGLRFFRPRSAPHSATVHHKEIDFFVSEVTYYAQNGKVERIVRCEESMTDAGMPIDGVSFHNDHRTFEDTPENRKILGDLCKAQALKDYHTLIGYQDSRKIIDIGPKWE